MAKADVPPHNPEAEAALVGRLLLDPGQLPLVAGTLKPEHIYNGDWRAVYAAMLVLDIEHRVIDLISVREIVGTSVAIPAPSRGQHGDLESYAEVIRRDWLRREAIRSLDHAARVAYSSPDQDALLEAVSAAVSQINRGADVGDLLNPEQAMDSYLGTLEARKAGMHIGLDWGIAALDKRLLPAQPGNLIVVAARPSIGKTAFVEWVADRWARLDRGPVLFVSLEMTKDELIDRAVSRQTDIGTDALIRGTLTGKQWVLAQEATDKLRAVKVWYYDRGSTTTARVRAEAARTRMLSEGRLAAIVVDYLQLLKDSAGGDNMVTRVTMISGALKAIAKDFGVPVIAPAQLNRQSEYRKDKHPTLADIRESGAIEQDADVVLGLHRPTKTAHRMDISILKSRQGGGADVIVPVRFNYENMTFTDWHEPTAGEIAMAAEAAEAAMASATSEDLSAW